MTKPSLHHMLLQVQVKALLALVLVLEQLVKVQLVKAQLVKVLLDLVQQVMALLGQVMSMELLNIHQMYLSSSIRMIDT
jgi:hypothetical protein